MADTAGGIGTRGWGAGGGGAAAAAVPFAAAGGSLAGGRQRRAGVGNQDAWCCRRAPGVLVAVVADGCGGTPHGGVGARLGALLLATALQRRLAAPTPTTPARALAGARRAVLRRLAALDRACGGDAAREHFLFTLLGAAITPGWTAAFALGDGAIGRNGRLAALGPYPGDAPPYLGHALLGAARGATRLAPLWVAPTATVRTILLATDGALALDPGGAALAGLWRDPRLFANPDALRRRLAVLARARPSGEAPDDATAVVLRRVPRGGRR